MARTPSSGAWLNATYSRAKGAAARRLDRIAHLEVRIAFHRHHLAIHERNLEIAKRELAKFHGTAGSFRDVIDMHESLGAASDAPCIRPEEAAVRYQNLSKHIFRELREGPLSVGDLRAALIMRLNVGTDHIPTFRNRLNSVLNCCAYKQQLLSLDPPWTEGRRWSLNPDYAPRKRSQGYPRKCVYQNSRGRLQPALWIIKTQQDLKAIRANYESLGTPLPVDLIARLNALLGVWSTHPLHFEVAERPVAKNAYAESVRSQVIQRLEMARAWMLDTEMLLGPDRVTHLQKVSLDAVRRALKRLLLEGRVQRRRIETTSQVEWAAIGVD